MPATMASGPDKSAVSHWMAASQTALSVAETCLAQAAVFDSSLPRISGEGHPENEALLDILKNKQINEN